MMEKLQLPKSLNEERFDVLRKLFPELFADGKFDVEALKTELSNFEEDEDLEEEHYGLNWPGKRKAKQLAARPSNRTFTPLTGDGIDEKSTANILIEGDNLEALKIMQQSYRGRIKMIYIDPPYNTGNDFIYKDNYRESVESFLQRTGQADEQGMLSSNPLSTGRYHTNWLNMMYPRLRLAKNLMRGDGVIFVSIDDHEVVNLRYVMNEIFGEENFVDQLIWVKNSTKNDSKDFATVHEYILCYAKDKEYRREGNVLFREAKPGFELVMSLVEQWNITHPSVADAEAQLRQFYQKNKQFKGLTQYKYVEIKNEKYLVYRKDNAAWPQGEGPRYQVLHPSTGKSCRIPERGWRWKESTMVDLLEKDLICFGKDETTVPQFKRHLHLMESNVVKSVIVNNDDGDGELRQLLNKSVFEHPKPTSLIEKLVEISTEADDTVLDFFAGSGTTGHAVMNVNQQDGGKRNFVLIQLDDPINREGFSTITDITKERLKRASEFLRGDKAQGDLGFQCYRLANSNVKAWKNYTGSNVNELEDLFVRFNDPLIEGWRIEHVLTEMLLNQGHPLDSEQILIEGEENKLWKITHPSILNKLFICLDDKIIAPTVKRLVSFAQPDDVFICLDLALDDQTKVILTDNINVKTI